MINICLSQFNTNVFERIGYTSIEVSCPFTDWLHLGESWGVVDTVSDHSDDEALIEFVSSVTISTIGCKEEKLSHSGGARMPPVPAALGRAGICAAAEPHSPRDFRGFPP